MDLGYVKVATFAPQIKVADVEFNQNEIKKAIDYAVQNKLSVLALPELCLTGSTVGDLFCSKTLIEKSESALLDIARYTENKNVLVFIGAPFNKDGLTYNVCAVIGNGKILGLVPKTYMSDHIDAPQKRYFARHDGNNCTVDLFGELVPFGNNLIFADKRNKSFKLAIEIGEEVCALVPPSVNHALKGARIIVNPSATCEFSGESDKKLGAIKIHSEKTACAYLYSNAGEGESTTDYVFSGHSFVCENGEVLAENKPFNKEYAVAEIDLQALDFERNKKLSEASNAVLGNYSEVYFEVDLENAPSKRVYEREPFIKNGEEDFLIRIQAEGLKKRVMHTNANKLVLGLSGGLDSTLALIVAVKTVELLGRSAKDILAITMPCFGTSSRTLDNSIKLAKAYGVTLKKIDLTKSVKRHLKDLSHPEDIHDAAYENAQARERTQLLMDIANMCNGLVIGTGDLSELALGWATYNGDHMSMYAVNGSIPKTLVRHLVKHTALSSKIKLKSVLLDILDTPVSPELIPSGDNKIKQVTEDIVGPYVLHDFFLYSMLKKGFTPTKIFYAALATFDGQFDRETILKWLKTFIRRFFNQQFKRSCLPDGVKVTEISLSPRGSWRMPSDTVSKLWLDELENLQ